MLAFRGILVYNQGMYSDDDNDNEIEESGSDELLSADDLRLPESANILVRLHALRAWLTRRLVESEQEIGSAALGVQEAMRASTSEARPRRRLSSQNDEAVQRAQRYLASTQQRLSAYEEAQTMLEDCVSHTTAGERLLVEYYLALEELVNSSDSPTATPWLEAMADVRHRVEQVGTPGEEED